MPDPTPLVPPSPPAGPAAGADRLAWAAAANVEAAAALHARALALPAARWTASRAPGKWAPWEEVQHLARSYALFRRAITGEYAFAPQVSEAQAEALRRTVLPRILVEDWFPSGAETVADARPGGEIARRELAVAEVDDAVRAFVAALSAAGAATPDGSVRHAYFGELPYAEFALVAAAHTRHHTRFL